jgi:hypothetical protein
MDPTTMINEPTIRAQLCSMDNNVQLECLKHLNAMISRQNDECDLSPSARRVQLEPSTLHDIIELIDSPHSDVQHTALWVITNAAIGPVEPLLKQDVVPRVIKCLGGGNGSDKYNVQAQAIWALHNITGDGPVARDTVLAARGLAAIIDMIKSHSSGPPSQLLEYAVNTLSNIFRIEPRPNWIDLVPVTDVVQSLFQTHYQYPKIAGGLLWLLDYITQRASDQRQVVMDTALRGGVYFKVFQYLKFDTPQAQLYPAMFCLNNLSAVERPECSQVIIDGGVLETLIAHIGRSDSCIKSTVCVILSNIAMGTPSQLQAVIDSTALSVILSTIRTHTLIDDNENAYMLALVIQRVNDEQLHQIVTTHPDVISQLCSLLSAASLPTLSSQLQSELLDAIECVLDSPYRCHCVNILHTLYMASLGVLTEAFPRELRKRARNIVKIMSRSLHLLTIAHTVLGDDTKASDSDLRCVVCLDNKRQLVAVECHHFSMCFKCAGALITRSSSDVRCPLCNCSLTKPMEHIFS